MNIELRFLEAQDIEVISKAFQAIGWNKPVSKYQRYLIEQEEKHRIVLIAFGNSVFAGYLNIVWKPDYPPLRTESIPEIQDFNVLPQYRRKGVGSRLMDKAEQIVSQYSSVIGIGVGMTPDYGAAQRLYVLRGYIPDGRGLTWENNFVKYGEQITVDDNLVLHFIKRLDT